MAKIRVLFYRADWDGHLLDDLISSWTWLFNMGTGPYSHAEIWIPGQNSNFKIFSHDIDTETTNPVYVGTCYTSTMRDEVNGVVKRPAAQVLRNPERWSYIEIEIGKRDYDLMVQEMNIKVAKNPGYDTWCIVSFICCPFRRWFKSPKFICSEFCYWALYAADVFWGKLRCPSPRRLSRWLVDKGYKINHLAGE